MTLLLILSTLACTEADAIMAKPVVRCRWGSMSPTNARNGSMEILIEASMIHSMPAAIHRVGELGMKNRATVVHTAPTRK